MLATAIWIDRPIKWHIRCTGDSIDDALRAIKKYLPFDAVRRTVSVLPFDPLPIKLFTQDMQPDCFKAITRIHPRPASVGRAFCKSIAV